MDETMAEYAAESLVNLVFDTRNNLTEKGGYLLLKKFHQNFKSLLSNEFSTRANACYADYIGCSIPTMEHDSTCEANLNIKIGETLEFLSTDEFNEFCENGVLIDLENLDSKTFTKVFNLKSDGAIDIFHYLIDSGYIVKWNVSKKMVVAFIEIKPTTRLQITFD